MRFIAIIVLMAMVQTLFAQDYTELVESGKKELEEGQYAKAAEYFQRATNAAESKSEKIYTLTNLGYAQRMSGKKESAAESYAKALAMDTASISLLTQRGNILLELDSAKEAIACYDKILERQPYNRDILRFRAGAHTAAGNYKEGKQDFIRLISTDNNDKGARLGLALLYEKDGNINDALMMLETLIEENPECPEYYIARSNIERTQKQPELALQDVRKALKLDGQNANYHILCAELLQELGHDDAALRHRRKAVKLMSTPQQIPR